jgi:tRNA nucleotidyltransferase (CCA-adding enzyme)
MNWERLKQKVLEKYYPDEEELEETQKQYQEISGFIEKEFGLETHFAGSASRGTCMKGDKDIDIFVLFPENLSRKELEEKGLEVGKRVFQNFDGDHHVEYAEHPYTKGEIEGHEVEIVPCYDVPATEIKSAVDRTPHHSKWVEENLSEEQRKEVVLLKTFLGAQDLYGSSLKVEGFSGYLCEILIAEHGGFKELLESAQRWEGRTVMDLENHHDGNLPPELVNKFDALGLVVIDPVDPERNVASVLSHENYSKFIYNAWQFNFQPGMNFFEKQEKRFSEFELKQDIQSRADFLTLEFDTPNEIDDILYPQMRKTLRRITQVLEKHDFRIFEKGFHVGEQKTRIFFELQESLPEVEYIQGPKVFHGARHLDQFKSKYENVFIEETRLVAKTERDFTSAKEMLKDFFDENLQTKGIPKHFAKPMDELKFIDPLEGDEEWLKYLSEKLHVQDK